MGLGQFLVWCVTGNCCCKWEPSVYNLSFNAKPGSLLKKALLLLLLGLISVIEIVFYLHSFGDVFLFKFDFLFSFDEIKEFSCVCFCSVSAFLGP